MTADFDPEHALRALHRAGVDFVLVGGLAAIAHGSSLVTIDTDITPDRASDNLERLAAALVELNARLRADGEPDGIAFPADAGFLAAQRHMLNLVTDAGDLDLTFTPSGFPNGYDDLRPTAVVLTIVGEGDTAVASLDDVIASKRAADRDKDRATLPYLEALRAEIETEQE